ncbi:MAG: poly-beta-1,6-N-acetyl-D-glucosamine biosynthesis protein PgaD [Oxalobacteraceae bacterium]|nr:poly-beta-1,6-N-acetyl-D-glucosamine biosynthesis protein PgaD [Oxalobacteraceae bacterium]
MKNLIFEKPSLAPRSSRVGWAFVTAFFWVVWVYLWMPLITLCMWALGFDAYSDYIQDRSSHKMEEMSHLFVVYLSVIAVLGGGLLAWARTEFIRFRDVQRRTRPLPTEVAELAIFAQVATATMIGLSAARRMVVQHDAHGRFLSAEILEHVGLEDKADARQIVALAS